MRSDALERRRRIVNAGCELLPSLGHQMTLEAVAERAGVGIATLYRNFPTRNALIYACVLQIAESVTEEIETAITALNSGLQDPEQLLRDLVPRIIPSGVNVLVPVLMGPPTSALPEGLREIKANFSLKVSDILAVTREHGLIHETVSDLDMINGLISLYSRPSFDLGSDFSQPYNVDTAVDIFLKGCEEGIQDVHTPSV